MNIYALKRECSVDNCSKEVLRKDLCRNHYRNLKLYGGAELNGLHKRGRKYHEYTIYHDSKTVLVKTIKGEYFWINTIDLHLIQNMTFHTNDKNYLYGGSRKLKTKQLHRLIMGEPEGLEIDHIDGNPLNNRRPNLRICTHSQNTQNITKRRNNKSGILGVCWCNNKKKWRAYITSNKKSIHIGYYERKEEAKDARMEKQIKLHGEYSRKNYA